LSYLVDRYANTLVIKAKEILNDETIPRSLTVNAFYNALKYDLENYNWKNQNILQDSSFFGRTLAHNGKNTVAVNQFDSLIPFLPLFNITIILVANIKVRQERLLKRIENSPELVTQDDLLVIDNPEKFLENEKILIYHMQRVFDGHIIDTSSTSTQKTADIILKKVNNL